MNLIRASIERPIAVVSAVLMVVMFGALALRTIPVQLAPDVRKPIITVTTDWFGAAPAEIEREIVNRQEDALKGLEGLEEMISSAQNGRGLLTPGGEHHEIGDGGWLVMTMAVNPPLRSPERTPDLASR
jgi:HAE1 family hydrophobic/amphiphilic exporter-1